MEKFMDKFKITALIGADSDYGLDYSTDEGGLAKSIKARNFKGMATYLVELKCGLFTLVNPDHVIETLVEKID